MPGRALCLAVVLLAITAAAWGQSVSDGIGGTPTTAAPAPATTPRPSLAAGIGGVGTTAGPPSATTTRPSVWAGIFGIPTSAPAPGPASATTTAAAATAAATTVAVSTIAVPTAKGNASTTAAQWTLPADADLVPPQSGSPFDTEPIYTQVTPSKWRGVNGSAENGYHLHGVGYSPFGGMDNVLCPPYNDTGGWCLTTAQVREDMEGLSQLTSRVKTYSSVCTNGTRELLEAARDLNMTIMFGVWLENNATKNLLELRRLVVYVREYSDVISHIIVGNEPVFVLGMPAAFVAESIRLARDMVANGAGVTDIPFGTTEIYNMWMNTTLVKENEVFAPLPDDRNMTQVVMESDFIGLNSHAYWSGIDPLTRRAGENVASSALAIQEKWGMEVIIAETGYPTRGDAHVTVDGSATPSEGRQSVFLFDMEMESRRLNLSVIHFEPFDGEWKRRWSPYIEMDYSFGFAYCNRTQKQIRFPPLGAT